MLFGSSGRLRDMSVVRCLHIWRRSAARRLGAVLVGYQGRAVQILPAGWAVRYQHQVAACSYNERAAAVLGPLAFE